jgi:hypothetical protein
MRTLAKMLLLILAIFAGLGCIVFAFILITAVLQLAMHI